MMKGLSQSRNLALLLGIVLLILLTMACAKSEKTGAPAPSPAPSSTPTPAPAATSSPAAPAAQPSPAPAPVAPPVASAAPAKASVAQPLVPGGPPFDKAAIEKEFGWQFYQKYDPSRLPLWTKAKYGGEVTGTGSIQPAHFNVLKFAQTHRNTFFGKLLYLDMGLCAMAGRDADFSRCNGKYAPNHGAVVVPGILDRWDQTNPLIYTFHVRSGVLWPATPPMDRTDRTVTAQDIAWFLTAMKQESAMRDNFSGVKTVEAIDNATVKITLSERDPDFLYLMAHHALALFPKECYDEKNCLQTKVISPAPFLIKEATFGRRFVLEKNPEFFFKGLPYVDRIVGIVIPDPQAQKAAFITRQIITIGVGTPPELEALLKQVPDARPQSVGILSGNQALRPDLKGPLGDARVRRAMAMTIDLPSLWQGAFGGVSLFPNLMSRQFFGDEFYMTLEQGGPNYQFNPTEAKKLLAEAGYPNGFSTSIQTISNSGSAYDMQIWTQSQWKKYLNIDAKIITTDTTAHFASVYEGTWKALWHYVCWNVNCWVDARTGFLQFLRGSPFNKQGISDQTMEDLYIKQRDELDPAKRVGLLWQFEQYELSQVYYIRQAMLSSILVLQPWEMNAASGETSYYCATCTPGWLAMVDIDRQRQVTGK